MIECRAEDDNHASLLVRHSRNSPRPTAEAKANGTISQNRRLLGTLPDGPSGSSATRTEHRPGSLSRRSAVINCALSLVILLID
jgi:hypothetical protein